MNTSSIKEQAKDYFKKNRTQFMIIFLIILLLQTIVKLFNIYNVFYGLNAILTILFIPINHGLIVSALKIVHHQGDDINRKDAFIGIKRFKELASTYIAYYLVTALCYIPIIIFLSYIMTKVYQIPQTNILDIEYNLGIFFRNFLLNYPSYLIAFIFIYILVLSINIILDGYLLAVPYLLEEKGTKGFHAIKQSIQIMKNHMKDYLQLFISFLPYILVIEIIKLFFTFFNGLQFDVITFFIVSIIEILTYRPIFILSRTIFYKNIENNHL